MAWKGRIRRFMENATGTRVYRTSALPHGVDLFSDLRRCLPKLEISVIFDIGANIGQTTTLVEKHFPGASIFSFEPAPANYHRLATAMERMPNVKSFNFGFSSTPDTTRHMATDGSPFMYRILPKDATAAQMSPPVALHTVDMFCQSRDIQHISFANIDTEGHDLEVLRGAENMLKVQAIDLLHVEAGANPGNTRHVPFAQFDAYLNPLGYYLFGIYEQWSEWFTGEPHLRRVNPVFISERVIAANRIKPPERK
jgi:FkbM family methyltransferase